MSAEQRWDENFEEVRRFRDEHGRWPKTREGALGNWCINQRKAKKGQGGKKGCKISPAQIAKLDGIGFGWGTTKTSQETVEPVGPGVELHQPQQAAAAKSMRKRPR